MTPYLVKKYKSEMTDLKAKVEELFDELQKHVEEYPQQAKTFICETKEKVLAAIQQSNSSIFSDILDQMQPLNFENL